MKKPAVKFYLRPTTGKHGMLIEAAVSWLGRRLQVKVGEHITPELWDKDRQRPVKIRRKELQELTARLDDVETFLQNAILTYKHERRLSELTVDKLRMEFKIWLIGGAPVPRTNEVLAWIDRYLTRLEALRPPTKKQPPYRSTYNNFAAFVSDKRGGTLAFQEVDFNLFCQFRDWLFSQGSGDNNVHKNLKYLKMFAKQAALQGEAVKEWNFSACADLGVCPEESDSIRLHESQLNALATDTTTDRLGGAWAKLPEHLDRVRDWFLIACYTGARYSDWAKLKDELEGAYKTGKKAVRLITVKTKTRVIIPIHPKLWAILEKYDGTLPPVLENQPFNRAIKEVFQLKGFDWMTQKIRKVKGRKITEEIPVYKRIGTHSGRRIFAYNAYYVWKIPIADIMAITGHATEAQCRQYIGESEELTENRLLGHDIFNYKRKKKE